MNVEEMARDAHKDFVREFNVGLGGKLPAKSYGMGYKWPCANSMRDAALASLTQEGIFEERAGDFHLTKEGESWAYGTDDEVMEEVEREMRRFIVRGGYEAGHVLPLMQCMSQLNAKQQRFFPEVVQKWENLQHIEGGEMDGRIHLTEKGFKDIMLKQQ